MSEAIKSMSEEILTSIMYSRSVRCFHFNFGRVRSTDGILDCGLILEPAEKQILIGLLTDKLSEADLPDNGAVIIDYEYDETKVLLHGSVQVQFN